MAVVKSRAISPGARMPQRSVAPPRSGHERGAGRPRGKKAIQPNYQPVPLASACTAEAPKSPCDVMWPRGADPNLPPWPESTPPTHGHLASVGHDLRHDPRIRRHSRFSWRRVAIADITERSVTALSHCYVHAGLLEGSYFAGVGVPISDHLIDVGDPADACEGHLPQLG